MFSVPILLTASLFLYRSFHASRSRFSSPSSMCLLSESSFCIRNQQNLTTTSRFLKIVVIVLLLKLLAYMVASLALMPVFSRLILSSCSGLELQTDMLYLCMLNLTRMSLNTVQTELNWKYVLQNTMKMANQMKCDRNLWKGSVLVVC